MERMAFPYQGTKQAIGVGVKKDSVYVYFAHNIQPNLTDDKVEDGFSEATRRVKFDDNVEEYRQTQDFGSAYIHIANYYDEYNSETSSFDNTNKNDLEFIQKLKNSKSLTTEFEWYGDGDVHFKHDLTGFGKAYEQAKKMCGHTITGQ